MKAMILAAGFGTRLFPLTIDRTKPAIPFLGKPLVGYVAEYVAKFGFDNVVVNLHHQPESVRKALGDGSDFGVKIHYTYEQPKILGTAGALDNARHLLEDETFLIANGKIITDIDIEKALETHKKSGALATMVLIFPKSPSLINWKKSISIYLIFDKQSNHQLVKKTVSNQKDMAEQKLSKK